MSAKKPIMEEEVEGEDNLEKVKNECAYWKKKYETLEKHHRQIQLRMFRIKDSEINVGEEIGKGSFGTVYRGNWSVKHDIAVKEINVHQVPREEMIQEFVNQVGLIHPNILRVFGFTSPTQKRVRIIMERMDCNLSEYIHDNKILVPQKIDIMSQMVDAVHYLHTGNPVFVILHRNIKSYDFLIAKDGKEVKLCDFGMMTRLSKSEEYIIDRTKSGTVMWKPPEVFGENPRFSVYSDIFSLGITFFEVLFERLPTFTDPSFGGLLSLCALVKKGKVSEIALKGLPLIEFKELLVKMLELEPTKRPTSLDLVKWFLENKDKLKEKYKDMRFPEQKK